jgi:hypothetical protein
MSVTLGFRRCAVALVATMLASAGVWVAHTDAAFAAGPVLSIGS